MFKCRPAALLAALPFGFGLTLWAADVWIAKPYTEWSEKDIQRIMTDSPWARGVSVVLGGLRMMPGMMPPPGPRVGIAETGGLNSGLGVGQSGSVGPPPSAPPGPPQTTLIVRWQSAMVVQQALVKSQYGDKSGTAPEARKRLEPNAAYYIISVANLPESQRPSDDEARKVLLGMTTLTAKGKDHPIVAKDVVYAGGGEGTIEARFLFPRDFAITIDDKEVEFATTFGRASVKARFNLKNMAIDGKLGL
jgi:hypothetical protein